MCSLKFCIYRWKITTKLFDQSDVKTLWSNLRQFRWTKFILSTSTQNQLESSGSPELLAQNQLVPSEQDNIQVLIYLRVYVKYFVSFKKLINQENQPEEFFSEKYLVLYLLGHINTTTTNPKTCLSICVEVYEQNNDRRFSLNEHSLVAEPPTEGWLCLQRSTPRAY